MLFCDVTLFLLLARKTVESDHVTIYGAVQQLQQIQNCIAENVYKLNVISFDNVIHIRFINVHKRIVMSSFSS